MSLARLIALPLVGLGLLASAGGSAQRSAIVNSAIAPIDAILERSPAKLCASFVPVAAEKLVPAAGTGETCEAAAANVFRAVAATSSQVTVIGYVKPTVEALDVSGSRASITVSGVYEVRPRAGAPRSRASATVKVGLEAVGPLRIELEERSGVWQVSSAARLAAVCPRTACAEGSSELLFSYGEPRPAPVKLVSMPAGVRRAGGAEQRAFEEGMRVTLQSGCLACHRIGTMGNRGPGQNLTHVGADLTESEIARALADPRKPMPSFRKLPAQKFRAVVRFLSLLR
jgi:mono/diheme cytochrome c family protein